MTSEALSRRRVRPATSRQTSSSAGPSSQNSADPGPSGTRSSPSQSRFHGLKNLVALLRNRRNDGRPRTPPPESQQSSSAPIPSNDRSVLDEIPILHRQELSSVKNAGKVEINKSHFIYNVNYNPDRNSSQTDGSQGIHIDDRINRSKQPDDIATSQKADYEIYYHQLLVKGRGSPLWEPGPNMMLPVEYRRSGVMFGDVGILYRAGNFDFLFNILLPENHEINKNRVPEGFYPLDRSEVESNNIRRNVIYGRNSFVASSSLQRTRKVNPSGFVYKTADKEGAILVMPDGASSEDLLNDKVLEEYVKANARSWYEYVTSANARGRRIENGDLHIVVGFDKVSSWGIATFANNVQEQVQFEFRSVDEGADAQTYEWESVNGRVGPSEREMRDLRVESDISESVLENQCVFLRSLNFSVSGEIWDKLAVHAVRSNQSKDGPPRSHGGSSNGKSDSLPEITVINPRLPLSVQHPSKLLNMKLLEKFPNAEIAITRDSDWISVITEGDAVFPDPEDFISRIMESHAIYEKDGIVTLKTSKRKEQTAAENLNDIPEAIKSHQRNVELTADQLGLTFPSDFERTGNLDNNFEAIQNQQRAVHLTPDGDDDQLPARLSSLGDAFKVCFERTGDLGDISKAIENHQRAVQLTPLGHDQLPDRLSSLGVAFRHRFESTNHLDDISEAIRRLQLAVELTPDGHAHLPAILSNLGTAFSHRFELLGDLDDISEAIQARERAVQLGIVDARTGEEMTLEAERKRKREEEGKRKRGEEERLENMRRDTEEQLEQLEQRRREKEEQFEQLKKASDYWVYMKEPNVPKPLPRTHRNILNFEDWLARDPTSYRPNEAPDRNSSEQRNLAGQHQIPTQQSQPNQQPSHSGARAISRLPPPFNFIHQRQPRPPPFDEPAQRAAPTAKSELRPPLLPFPSPQGKPQLSTAPRSLAVINDVEEVTLDDPPGLATDGIPPVVDTAFIRKAKFFKTTLGALIPGSNSHGLSRLKELNPFVVRTPSDARVSPQTLQQVQVDDEDRLHYPALDEPFFMWN